MSASPSPAACGSHLQPSTWAAVNRHLVAKALAEFSHELLLQPVPLERHDKGWESYSVQADDPDIEYLFRAQRLELDHWWIDRSSIRKLYRGGELPVDAERFVIEFREKLGISPEVLPDYLEEVSCTLVAAAYKRASDPLSARELARSDFQTIEAAMTEGHPIFVANSGRIGFNALDYRAYAPETGATTQLRWLGARRERVNLGCVEGLRYEEHLAHELGAETLSLFAAVIAAVGANPDDYLFIPVHPWQWENRLQHLFAGDLACRELIDLGVGADRYQPQQSIRTLFNRSRPERCYVKTALSILNMGFVRGMSPKEAVWATAVNDWILRTVTSDPYLRACGFSLLREVVYIGYRHRHYERAISAKHDPYKELLAALWRESPMTRIGSDERLLTMAALLHIDAAGGALLLALVERSGLSLDDWLRAYLRAYLCPLLHCFYAHGVTFTPHCENLILVLKDEVPVRVFMKDLGEDIGVLNPEVPLPEEVRGLALAVPEEVMTLAIFTDVFDCVFRLLAPLLLEHAAFPERRFWSLVAECIRDYQASQPALAARFERYDLFAPTFIRNCLNRLQLKNNRLMVDLNAAEPVESLQFVGTLRNPIAGLQEVGATLVGGPHGCA